MKICAHVYSVQWQQQQGYTLFYDSFMHSVGNYNAIVNPLFHYSISHFAASHNIHSNYVNRN